MGKYLDIEFLEFLEPDDGIPKDVDITTFIMEKFPIPNIEDLEASFYDTNALRFLRKSENNGYFSYYENALSPIHEKWQYDIGGKKYRHWFDKLKPHVYAKIQDLGIQRLYEYRTNEILKITNKSIVDTNKAVKTSLYIQIGVGIITMIAIVLTAIYAITSYYKPDSENLILIRKAMQHQDSILESIQKLQTEKNTSLTTEAKKTSPKKP